ncbi:DUF1573 domain-containing protein [Bacteroides sp. 51]|uniref:DUF1573 domain-containing protein n=1 Tax=Bacteroides sp. 51 TaxID=2302938 RepID=UPI0013D3F85D|nr:DUF1573 domain-containing protein [Bacteroides sp. 51]NDV83483.1 DUF1573 domain-containing protein [Bacteroides sp. 51]
MKVLYYLFLLLILCACKESDQQKKERLVSEWCGKEIAFPANILCVSGEDTLDYKVPYADFLVVTYADSIGCVNLRRNISSWKRLIAKSDSLTRGKVSFMFFLNPIDIDEMRYIFHKEKFTHPICYDLEGRLQALNKFPEETDFRSFLLDVNRQVLAIGNPALDVLVEKEYSKIIRGGGILNKSEEIITEISYESDIFEMGDFDWQHPHHITVSLRNTGDKPLVVEDVITSCSCIYVEYSREPVMPGKKWDLYIRYKAERPEFFNRDITIYCNVPEAPLNFKVRGNAK